MADTTVDKVLAIASHLEDLETTTIEMYIDDAQSELEGTEMEDNERAQRYLAAHFGTLNIRRPTSESVENVSVSYNAEGEGEGLLSTKYGQEVERLFNEEKGATLRLYS